MLIEIRANQSKLSVYSLDASFEIHEANDSPGNMGEDLGLRKSRFGKKWVILYISHEFQTKQHNKTSSSYKPRTRKNIYISQTAITVHHGAGRYKVMTRD